MAAALIGGGGGAPGPNALIGGGGGAPGPKARSSEATALIGGGGGAPGPAKATLAQNATNTTVIRTRKVVTEPENFMTKLLGAAKS